MLAYTKAHEYNLIIFHHAYALGYRFILSTLNMKFNQELDIRNKIKNTSLDGKRKIAAMWCNKARVEGRKLLPVLLFLDNEYDRIYKENRIKKGFEAASLLAYEHVFEIIFSA